MEMIAGDKNRDSGMHQRKRHLRLRMIVFGAIAAVLLLLLSAILNEKWDKYENYYRLDDETIDYVTIGASHCLHSLNPLYIYAQTGVKGYNLADEAQSIAFSYYWLKEAVRTHKPKVVFFDVGNLLYTDFYMAEAWKLKEYAAMRPTLNKAACIRDTAGSLETGIGGFIPLFYYHDRWKTLTESDFSVGTTKTNGASIEFVADGSPDPETVNLFEKDYYGNVAYSRGNEISDENKEYFRKMVSLCDKEEIQLIPTKFPTNSWDDERSALVDQFLGEYGLHLLNLNNMVTSINWESDSYDGGYHTNYWGGIKTSEAVGNYLTERIGITGGEWERENGGENNGVKGGEINEEDNGGKGGEIDGITSGGEKGEIKNGKADAFWKELLDEYCGYETDSLIRGEDQREEYWNWLVETGPENLVILSANGYLNGEQESIDYWLKRLGLSGYSESEHNQSFIAVIDQGKVFFEKWNDRIMEFNDTFDDNITLCVVSSGNKSHIGNLEGKANILINGKSVEDGGQGLNIVVYDKENRKVISSTTQYNAYAWVLENTDVVSDYDTESSFNDRYEPDPVHSDWLMGAAGESGGITDQRVKALPAGGGTYYICNEEGRYLAVSGGSNQADTPVLWQKYTGTAVQRWLLRTNYDGTYSIVSLYNHRYLGAGVMQMFSVNKDGDKGLLVLK